MKITLKPTTEKDYNFLYCLLEQRPKEENISHRKMPTYKEHCDFNASNPYVLDKIIYENGEKIGRFYLTEKKEIGIHLLPGVSLEAVKLILDDLDGQHFLNVSPNNKQMQKLLKKLGYEVIQYTYEKNLSA